MPQYIDIRIAPFGKNACTLLTHAHTVAPHGGIATRAAHTAAVGKVPAPHILGIARVPIAMPKKEGIDDLVIPVPGHHAVRVIHGPIGGIVMG